MGWAQLPSGVARLPPTRGRLAWRLVVATATVLAGCSDCANAARAVQEFTENRAHVQCESDSDCTAVYVVNCVPCGRIALNRAAARSVSWTELNESVAEACDNECALCDTFVSTPRCTDGTCN